MKKETKAEVEQVSGWYVAALDGDREALDELFAMALEAITAKERIAELEAAMPKRRGGSRKSRWVDVYVHAIRIGKQDIAEGGEIDWTHMATRIGKVLDLDGNPMDKSQIRRYLNGKERELIERMIHHEPITGVT